MNRIRVYLRPPSFQRHHRLSVFLAVTFCVKMCPTNTVASFVSPHNRSEKMSRDQAHEKTYTSINQKNISRYSEYTVTNLPKSPIDPIRHLQNRQSTKFKLRSTRSKQCLKVVSFHTEKTNF